MALFSTIVPARLLLLGVLFGGSTSSLSCPDGYQLSGEKCYKIHKLATPLLKATPRSVITGLPFTLRCHAHTTGQHDVRYTIANDVATVYTGPHPAVKIYAAKKTDAGQYRCWVVSGGVTSHASPWVHVTVTDVPCLFNNMCANSGRCINRDDQWKCDCEGTGYTGDTCTVAAHTGDETTDLFRDLTTYPSTRLTTYEHTTKAKDAPTRLTTYQQPTAKDAPTRLTTYKQPMMKDAPTRLTAYYEHTTKDTPTRLTTYEPTTTTDASTREDLTTYESTTTTTTTTTTDPSTRLDLTTYGSTPDPQSRETKPDKPSKEYLALHIKNAIRKSLGNKKGEKYICPSVFGYYPHPRNPCEFIQCSWYIGLSKVCAPGTVWSQAVRTCVWKARFVSCHQD